MTLPLKAIERLFDRLTLTYGRAFMAQWEGMPAGQLSNLKTLWADELSIFSGRLESVAWALENLPARAPNIVEFKNLCKSAPKKPEALQIEAKADPARIAAELEKLSELKKAKAAQTPYDGKQWARNIIARYEAGEKVKALNLRFAREALRIGTPLEVTE